MTQSRGDRAGELIRQMIAEYIARESNHLSLITVTGVSVSDKLDKALVLFTVLPETYEEEALKFLKRQANDIRLHIRTKVKMHTVPFLIFTLDKGEKNRQRIDELSAE